MNNFERCWRGAKVSVFRLEGLPEYKIPGEAEMFLKWKKGEQDGGNDAAWQKWMTSLKNAKAKKVTVRRLRITPKPLPDYVKFEIDLWRKYSTKNGEEILFIDESEYRKIVAREGFSPKDFWLFDEKELLIFNYGKVGQFQGDIQITDGGMIKRYRDLKEKLLQKAFPMELSADKE